MPKVSRLEILLFAATFVAFAWFHQGGGWNQNSRFAEVRAMGEEGRFGIDDYFIYFRGGNGFTRARIENGDYMLDGRRHRLVWDYTLADVPPHELHAVNDLPVESGMTPESTVFVGCSGDVSFARGHFHPNKPPGASFAALPAYAVIYRIEKLFGLNTDGVWMLTMNLWLCSVFSVGLASAIGSVIFFRTAMILSSNQAMPSLLATVAFAFGTLYFPFATLLFDHNLTAVGLLAAFYFIIVAARDEAHRSRNLYLSGLCAGFAAITNYIAAIPVALVGGYLLAKKIRSHLGVLPPRVASPVWFGLGVLGPFLLICFYNLRCYGSPFALCNDFQNPVFKDSGGGFLGMFGAFRLPIAEMLLWSQYRGIFVFAPVLLLGAFGFVEWMRAKLWTLEALFCVAIFALFYAVNATFYGWNGGCTTGPRYLIPAMPFLALLTVPAFARFPKSSCAVAVVSIAINFLSAAVDAECPVGVSFIATIEGRSDWENKPVAEYTLPFFLHGRAWPLLDAFMDENLRRQFVKLHQQGLEKEQLKGAIGALRGEMLKNIEHGTLGPADTYSPLLYLSTIHGPVSVNPIGPCEGNFYMHVAPRSPEAIWNSFNVGEFIFPESRWSVVPMVLASGGLLAAAIVTVRRPA